MSDGTPVHLRVFLSSPGDVTDERNLARQVLRKLEKERTFKGQIDLEEISWDDPDQAHPLDAHLTPQKAIDRSLAAPSACDIVVVVFWSRMGTPLPREYAKPDGSAFRSGTEYEFVDAITSAEKTGRPSVWVYRRDEELRVGAKDPRRDEILQQADAVEVFFGEFQDETGAIRRTYFRYASPSQFQTLFEGHLRERLSELLDERSPQAFPTPLTASVAGPEGLIQAEVWQGNPYRGLSVDTRDKAP